MQNLMRGADFKDQQLPQHFYITNSFRELLWNRSMLSDSLAMNYLKRRKFKQRKSCSGSTHFQTSTLGTGVYIWTADIKGKAKRVEQQLKQSSIDNLQVNISVYSACWDHNQRDSTALCPTYITYSLTAQHANDTDRNETRRVGQHPAVPQNGGD